MRGILLLLIAGLFVFNGYSQTTVSGQIISTDTTWHKSGSPYIIEGNIIVKKGTTLTIEAGTEVKVNANIVLQIDGELIAIGTPDEHISFTSNLASPKKGDWLYLFFTGTSLKAAFDQKGVYQNGSILKFCDLSFGGKGDKGMVYIDQAAPYISSCQINNSQSAGIYLNKSFSRIDSCNISGNNYMGIEFENTKDVDVFITDNIIDDNNIGGIVFVGCTSYTNNIFLIKNNTIRNNAVNGGIKAGDENMPGGLSNITFKINGNRIYNNKSSYKGGGIYMFRQDAEICYNEIENNEAQLGGGIYIHGGYKTYPYFLLNNTIKENKAHEGAAINISLELPYGSVYASITYNIIENNSGNSAIIMSGSSDVNSYNFVGSFSFLYNTIQGNTGSSTLDLTKFHGNIEYNDIYGNNTTYDIYNRNEAGTYEIKAINNYWGPEISSAISAKLYDFFDDGTKSLVTFEPFLSQSFSSVQPPPAINWSSIGDLRKENILLLASVSNDTMIAFTPKIARRIFNKGGFWEDVPGPSGGYYSLAVDPNKNIFVGTGTQLLKTTNCGSTWTELNNGIFENVGYALAINSDGNIFAGAITGIYRSLDHGASWSLMRIGLSGELFMALAINSKNEIFAGAKDGIFMSSNNGNTWVKLENKDSLNCSFLAIDSHDNILAVRNDALYRSINNGETWIKLNNDYFNSSNYILSLVINSAGYIIVGTTHGIFRSTDDGESWYQENLGLGNTYILSMIITPDDIIYVGTYGGGIFKSNEQNAVPVELVSFNSSVKQEKVILTWITATETNNKGFEIERNYSESWQRVAFVDGHGTTASKNNYSYTDNLSEFLTSVPQISYRLKQVDLDGSFKYSQIVTIEPGLLPRKYLLSQNFPNPFNPVTTIKYSIPEPSQINISIYDILGSKVMTLIDEQKPAGNYKIDFNASNLASGIYFYELRAGNFREIKKMTLLR